MLSDLSVRSVMSVVEFGVAGCMDAAIVRFAKICHSQCVRVFKNKWFDRFARKVGISDDDLKSIVTDLENGQWDANYGGDVYKKRIARRGSGKSGGYRAIIIFKKENRAYFSYAFPKTEKSDITDKEEQDLKKRAKDFFGLTDEQIQARLAEGSLVAI
ncbi:MAG: hypothetical protein Ta2A_14030 [Treponemataceae bacterium]|nr:MAG: hypothetical protein Ta2A_14030 [Treponemataceae bacterium]